MPAKSLWAAMAVLTLLLSSSGGLAHRDATGIVKQRMDAMEDMARAMKALRAMMRGRQPYDAERVRTYARVVAGHGAEKLTVLFPEGSLHHPTRAKPVIWADWERFAAMARELTVYAGAHWPRRRPTSAGRAARRPGNGRRQPASSRPWRRTRSLRSCRRTARVAIGCSGNEEATPARCLTPGPAVATSSRRPRPMAGEARVAAAVVAATTPASSVATR